MQIKGMIFIPLNEFVRQAFNLAVLVNLSSGDTSANFGAASANFGANALSASAVYGANCYITCEWHA